MWCVYVSREMETAEGSTRHRSASLTYSWDPVTWKRKLSWWIRKVMCLKSFCCFCLTFMWGMGMDCSVKLSKIGVFQHENKLLGTSGFVQIHFSISRYSWSLSETRTCILSSCMTPKLLMLLYRGSCWPLAQSVCNCQCLSPAPGMAGHSFTWCYGIPGLLWQL